MGDLAGMEQAVTSVRYPYMRREAIRAVAALADRQYQERVWVNRLLPHPNYYDALDEEIHWLFDDLELLPDPGPADGDVLLPGDECAHLRNLGAAFDPMIDRLGDAPDDQYLADPEWPSIVDLAQLCLPAMILAGGWERTETDAELYGQLRAQRRIPTVSLPATRRRAIRAVAALADTDFQQRTWPNPASPTSRTAEPADPRTDPVAGSLTACLHTLTDDTHVLPDPHTAIGRVLLPGDETNRLTTLRDALAPLRTDPPAEPWTTPHWPTVVTTARTCLPALIIAGAWIGPDPQTDVTEPPETIHP